MIRPVVIRSLTRVVPGAAPQPDQDLLAVEAPLSVLVESPHGTLPLGVLMRTPGHDADLAIGALVGEGVLQSPAEIVGVRVDAGALVVTVTANARVEAIGGRGAMATSACGLCGRLEVLSLEGGSPRTLATDTPLLRAEAIAALPAALRTTQAAFAATGGLHAAAVCGPDGRLELVREDVGRHNAVDKVIGARFRDQGLPSEDTALVVSGRVAYEIVQKAARAGIPVIVAIGAPTDLAADAARSAGITLVGFTKAERFNVYTHGGRIVGLRD